MYDLIFVSMENWDDTWRRNQFLCAGLARRYPATRILFVGPAIDISNGIRRGRLELNWKCTRTLSELPNITLTNPIKLMPNTLPIGRRINERMERLLVRREQDRLGIRNPTLWLNPHYALHMAGAMNERAVVYDITDDWTSLTQSRALKRLVETQDNELCHRADAVIVCSQRLYEMKRAKARNLYLIPNGVHAEHYANVLDGTDPIRGRAARWPKPVLGYTGTIHPDRVDVDLIAALSQAVPEGTIALVGPNMLRPQDEALLKRRSNVALTGAIPYSEIPETMRAFNVCITPHRVTPFTESLNPIKLWEYLAAGKPIVSTDVAGFRDYSQFVRIAIDQDGFLRAVREALAEDGALGEPRRAEARRHSWNVRLDAVETVLSSLPGG